jgi:hypothetical protein
MWMNAHKSLDALERELKRGTHITRSKFEDPDSSLYPPAIPAWKKAQLDVQQDRYLFIYEVCRTDMGYVVPEPAWLVSTKNIEKSRSMLRSWLRYRPVFLYRLSSSAFKVLPIHNEGWAALITADYIAATAKNCDAATQSQRREQFKRQLLTTLANSIGSETDVALTSRLESPGEPEWFGISFNDMQPVHFEQLLWELCEINFRFEFQALNNRISRDPSHPAQTLTKLLACFPGESMNVDPSLANHGVASLDRRERSHYIFAMASVMEQWPGMDRKGWIVKMDKLTWHEEEMKELEEEVASTYTQFFFNNFRRAAILPRRLSPEAVAAWPRSAFVTAHIPKSAPILDNDPSIVVNRFAS